MPVNDDWKEHLGFISGTVLVWALILMKLLPIAAGMQLPNGIHYVDPHGSADIDLLVFSLLTVSGALGITGIILGVFHIVARGLWLATAVDNSKQGSAPALDNFCRKTFVSVFVVAKIAIIILLPGYPLFFVVIGLQRGLHRLLSVDSFGVGMGLYMFVQTVVFVTVFVTVMLVFAFWQRRAAGGRTAESGPARLSAFYGRIRDGMGSFQFLLFAIAMVGTFYLSYKAELSIPKSIYDKTTTAADVYVKLGGMTSDITKVCLVLVNGQSETIRTLENFDLGEGSYVARIDLSGLSPGRYGVILAYPYIDISLVPFRVHYLRREQWFLVAI